MEVPRAVLSEADSMPLRTRTRTHSVTGDASITSSAPATAPLDASIPSLPPNSEADFEASNSSTAALQNAAELQKPFIAASPSTNVVSSAQRPGPSNRRPTYREFFDETSNSLAAVFSSMMDESDSETSSPPSPLPLAEALPDPPSNAEASNDQRSNAEASNDQRSNAEASNDQRSNAEASNDQRSNAEASNDQRFNAEASNDQRSNAEASNDQRSDAEASNVQPSNTGASNVQRSNARPETSRISRSRSLTRPGGLSGLLFTDAVHRMLKHLALTQMHVGTEWLTLLQIFTENGGNGASRFHDVQNLTVIRDYAILRPDRQPDVWFSLRDRRSLRALTYFVRLATQYAWWTCRYINVLQAPTPSAAIAISRILKRLRPTLHGITFPQSPDFWSGRETHDIRRSFTWLPIDQPNRKYVRGVYCYANHLIEPDYWTQSHLVRVHIDGCGSCSYTRSGVVDYITAFSFYRDFPPYPYIADPVDSPPRTESSLQYLTEATNDDYILQASITWPSNFFYFWQDFGTHYTVLHIRPIASCHQVSPREFILQLMPRIRNWPRLRHVQIEFQNHGETHPGDSLSLADQATEYATEIYNR